MRASGLLCFWFVTFLICASSDRGGPVPTTDYDQTHRKSNYLEETSMSRHETLSSPTTLFALGNLLQHFINMGRPVLPVDSGVKAKQVPVSDSEYATSNLSESLETKKSISDSSGSSSESTPQTLTVGKEFRISAQQPKHEISDFTADAPSSGAPASTTAYQPKDETNSSAKGRVSTFKARGHAIDELGRWAGKSILERTGDRSLETKQADPQLPLERLEMSIPAQGKMAVSEDERKNASHEKTKDSPVSQRIREYAEKASSVPPGEAGVTIVNAKVPRERVAIVGDIDGNKVQDYIITNVAAKNYSGTVRLYLMAEQNKFLYTRELVPGNWGFEHSDLKPGDRFGTTVFRLPSNGNSSQCFIAITAPGDRTTKDANGAVYVLELSAKGSVNKHTKLSATDFLHLFDQQQKEEQKASTGRKPEERYLSSLMQRSHHLDGVTAMVFLNASGAVQAFINVKTARDKELLHTIGRHLREDKSTWNQPKIRVRPVLSREGEDGSCMFNTTHCDCKLDRPGRQRGDCYEMFESEKEEGRFICLAKACPPSYKCSCDGDERCRKVEEVQEIYIPHAKGTHGDVYCTVVKRLVSQIVPVSTS